MSLFGVLIHNHIIVGALIQILIIDGAFIQIPFIVGALIQIYIIVGALIQIHIIVGALIQIHIIVGAFIRNHLRRRYLENCPWYDSTHNLALRRENKSNPKTLQFIREIPSSKAEPWWHSHYIM